MRCYWEHIGNTLGTLGDHIRNVKKMKKIPPTPLPQTGKKKTRASFHWLHGEYGCIFIFELIDGVVLPKFFSFLAVLSNFH